jgi:hypothetical protein
MPTPNKLKLSANFYNEFDKSFLISMADPVWNKPNENIWKFQIFKKNEFSRKFAGVGLFLLFPSFFNKEST